MVAISITMERDRPHRFGRITTGRSATFHGRLRPKGVEIHRHDAANRIDRAHALTARAQRTSTRIFDVCDVRRHLRPDRFRRRLHDPAAYFLDDLRILAHGRAHLALGQTVRAGEIQLKRIDARAFAALDDLAPRILVVFLHDRRDQHAGRVHIFALFKFVDPDLEFPIAN
jgi:hypothetical protein